MLNLFPYHHFNGADVGFELNCTRNEFVYIMMENYTVITCGMRKKFVVTSTRGVQQSVSVGLAPKQTRFFPSFEVCADQSGARPT